MVGCNAQHWSRTAPPALNACRAVTGITIMTVAMAPEIIIIIVIIIIIIVLVIVIIIIIIIII
eukprot:3203190-Karenia_brevis.AAC.1